MSHLLQRNQPLAQPPAISSHNGVLATTVTLGFVSASLSCGPNCVSPPFTAYALNGSIPGPSLHARAGDVLRVRFRNLLAGEHGREESGLHFHGAVGFGDDPTVRVQPGREHPYEMRLHASHGGRSIQAGEQGEPRRARREH